MKIKIQSILASLLVVSLLTCSASAMSFPDVPADSDYVSAVEYISDLKIMVGDTQGNFNPDKIVSRAEMATVICRMLNKTENLPTSTVFTDVPINHWANAYIGQVAALGIIGGYGNGKYGPNDPVTYEQAVTMVIRVIGKGDKAITYGGYPNGYLQAAQEDNLLNGIQAEQGQGLTRGLVAVLLYNYYNVGHTHNFITKTIPGGGGHYEQVQVGTEKVLVRNEKRQYAKCTNCDSIMYTNDEMYGHSDPGSPYYHPGCEFAGHYIYTEYVPVYEEKPIYENKWIEDSSTIIRVCSICGAQE